MNKRTLMKRGYLVDDRITYDEDGEAIVRNYKVNKNRGGGNSATVIIENAVITTDPVSIKTLSEKSVNPQRKSSRRFSCSVL